MKTEKINLTQLSEIESLTNALKNRGLDEKGYKVIPKNSTVRRYKLKESFDFMTYTEVNEFIRGYGFAKKEENESENLIRKIDFKQLHEQKAVLNDFLSGKGNMLNMHKLGGLLILLDNIQDHAVDKLGIDEDEVFPEI